MRHFAIVGSGPAGFYTAEALAKAYGNEARMGERVAHMAVGKMIDYIEFDDNFAIAKTRAPAETAGKTLDESGVRTKHGVTVVGVKRPRTDFDYATPETLIDKDDLLIVSGRVDLVEAFCALD